MRCRALAMLPVLVGAALSAAALVESGELRESHFTVYAPDWTWQKQDINILAVFDNPTQDVVTHTVELVIPETFRGQFGHRGTASIPPDVLTRSVTVPAGTTARTAITGVTALDGFPLQRYPLTLRVTQESTAAEVEVAYELQTIRGAAVNPGKWALYLPVGVALLFCIVFALVISRFADRGAWKRVSVPLTEAGDAPAWVNEEP